MFKYLKWELIDDIKNMKIFYFIIAFIYLLVFLLPSDFQSNIITNFISLAFYLFLLISVFMSFFYGAKKTMDSYKKPTFLLESMIPLSPRKIILLKYLLAIVYNFIYALIFMIGCIILFSKVDINLIESFVKTIFSMDLDVWKSLFKLFLFVISSSMAFTALISLVFVVLKSYWPNGNKGYGIISYFISSFIFNLISSSLIDYLLNYSYYEIIYSVLMLLLVFVCYLFNVWLVENKLEIYS